MLYVDALKQGIEIFLFVRRCLLVCYHEYHSCPAAQVLAQPTMPQEVAFNLHAFIVCIKSYIFYTLHGLLFIG